VVADRGSSDWSGLVSHLCEQRKFAGPLRVWVVLFIFFGQTDDTETDILGILGLW
jgi:hypothetical protein